MVYEFILSEEGRKSLGTISVILCSILSLAGLVLIGIGIYTQIHITNELLLLKSYNSGLLPHFIVGVGTVMFLLNVAAVKCVLALRDVYTRRQFRAFLVPLVFTTILFVCVILAAGIFTMLYINKVEVALYDGLWDSMKRYKNNLVVKVTIDRIQMRSQCCGSVSYKDWFKVAWINTDYINMSDPITLMEMKQGKIEGVPFSCCNVKARAPCITRNYKKRNNVKNISATVYHRGCTQILLDRFENKILKPSGVLLLALCGGQALVVMFLWFLQISLKYTEEDMEGKEKDFLYTESYCAPSAESHGFDDQRYDIEDSEFTKEEFISSNRESKQDFNEDSSLLSQGLDKLLDLMDRGSDGGGSDDQMDEKNKTKNDKIKSTQNYANTKEKSESKKDRHEKEKSESKKKDRRDKENSESKKKDRNDKEKTESKKKDRHEKEKSESKKKDRNDKEKSESKKMDTNKREKSELKKKDRHDKEKSESKKRDRHKREKSELKKKERHDRDKSESKKKDRHGRDKSESKKKDRHSRDKSESKKRDRPGRDKSELKKKDRHGRNKSESKKSESRKRNQSDSRKKGEGKKANSAMKRDKSKSPTKTTGKSVNSKSAKKRHSQSRSKSPRSKQQNRTKINKISKSPRTLRTRSKSTRTARSKSRRSKSSSIGSKSMKRTRYGSKSKGKSRYGSNSKGKSRSKSSGKPRFGSKSMGKSRFGSRSSGKSKFGSKSKGKSRSRSSGKSRFGSMSMGKSRFGSRSMGRSSKGMSSGRHMRRH